MEALSLHPPSRMTNEVLAVGSWEGMAVKDAGTQTRCRYPNAFLALALLPHNPPAPAPALALPKAFSGSRSPFSSCTLRSSLTTESLPVLCSRTHIDKPSPAPRALPSSHAAPNSGRRGGAGVLRRVRRRLLAVLATLSEALGLPQTWTRYRTGAPEIAVNQSSSLKILKTGIEPWSTNRNSSFRTGRSAAAHLAMRWPLR